MPHSSGGGFSGGGFHSSSGGGHGSSGSSNRTSTRPFPGAFCYVYYTRAGYARTLYTNRDPKTVQKTSIGTWILLAFFFLVPIGVVLFTGNHTPKKLDTNYATTILVQDDLNVLSAEEEATLDTTFHEFFDISGICPSIVTVQTENWKTKYANLQGFAYDKYLNLFKDESHWLIVYSADDTSKKNWAFEGMQGNDTDGILSKKVTDAFNKTCYDNLTGATYTVGGAIDNAFRTIMPTMMDRYFYVEPSLWIFVGIWEAVMVLVTVSTVLGVIRNKNLKTAVKVEGEVKRAMCPHCGNEYIRGTIDRCPKCQAFLDDEDAPRYVHFEDPSVK